MKNPFNIISKMTDEQIKEHMFSTTENILDSLQANALSESYQIDREEPPQELTTLDDGRTIYYDDKGYYTLKSNGHRHSLSNLRVKELLNKQTNTIKENTMKTEQPTMSFKDYYLSIATRVQPEQIIADFDLQPDSEIYIQPEREYKGRFYPASYLFTLGSQIIAVSDLLNKDGEYNIRTGLTDVALFMIVRTLINDGQVELPKRASRVIEETGNKVYTVNFLGGNYDAIINDGTCVYAGKARPSEQELRNRRLAQLKNLKHSMHEKKLEAEQRMCSQEYHASKQDNHYDGKSIHE